MFSRSTRAEGDAAPRAAPGSGRNSMVYLAKCKHTGFKIALKVYPKAVMSAVHKQQVMREITIHSKLQHRY